MKNIKKTIGNFFFLLKPLFKHDKLYIIISAFIFFIVLPINSFCSVIFTQDIVDAVAKNSSFETIINIISKYILILFFISSIQISYEIFYKEKALFKIQQILKLKIYEKVLLTDYKFFDDPEFYNNYSWAINEYISKILEAHQLFLSFLRSISTIIMMASLIFVIGPWIVIITVVELIFTTMIQIKRNKINLEKREKNIAIDRKFGYIHRVFYQREYAADLRITNIKNILLKMFDDNTSEKENNISFFAKKSGLWAHIHNSLGIVYNAFILGYISYEIVITQSIVGIGKFSSLLSANNQLVNSLSSIFTLYSRTNNLSLYADKIRSFFNAKSTIESQIDGIKLNDKMPFSVDINNVSFSYNKSNFSLKNINIKIEKGEKIAIVGANGSGKTTLMKLLLRLYDTNEGNISYNGISIKDLDLTHLRKSIGISSQDTNIYATTLANNIQLNYSITDDEIMKIVNIIGLSNILEKNSCDINQEMTREFSNNGIMLSEGEKQKVGLARIMTHNYKLILLDEPSSSLDPVSEYHLMRLLFSEANKTTTIIISHRLSMVRDAQCIYVMDKGKIIEKGTHNQLMKLKGNYFDMYSKQSENYIEV